MNSLAPPPPNENQLWFQRPRCGARGGEQDGARGQSNRTGTVRACSKAQLGGREVTEERRQVWAGDRCQVRPDLGEGTGQTWRGKEIGTGRRSKGWGRGSEKHRTDGEMVLRGELERG